MRYPAITKFAKFGRRCPVHAGARSKLGFGGPRAAKSSLRCANTHPTTGDPHVSRMSAWSLAWPLRQKPLLRRDVASSPSSLHKAQSGVCIHNWTSMEPVFAAGTLTSLALSSDRVLHLVGVKGNLQPRAQSRRQNKKRKQQCLKEVLHLDGTAFSWGHGAS